VLRVIYRTGSRLKMSSTAATVAHATSLFQTALLYTISSEAISSLIATANASYIPIVVICAFGGVGVAIRIQNLIAESIARNQRQTTTELYQLLQHLVSLSIDILVQLASNGVGRLVLFAFIGSASIASTILGVVISIILLWALRQSVEVR